MKTWQAAALGMVIGVVAMFSIGQQSVGGSPAKTPDAVAPMFVQVSDHEIVGISRINDIYIGKLDHGTPETVVYRIGINFGNSSTNIFIHDEASARAAWKNLQSAMHVAPLNRHSKKLPETNDKLYNDEAVVMQLAHLPM